MNDCRRILRHHKENVTRTITVRVTGSRGVAGENTKVRAQMNRIVARRVWEKNRRQVYVTKGGGREN